MKKDYLKGNCLLMCSLLVSAFLQGQCIDYTDSVLVLERGVPNKVSALNWLQLERGTAELTRAYLSESFF